MEAPPVERHLAAILAADVEGYSRLMHGDEETTLATLSARRAVVDELIGRYRGRIANTAGDSVLAEFMSWSTRFTVRSRSRRRFKQRMTVNRKGDRCASGSASMSAT